MDQASAVSDAATGWIDYWRQQLETGQFPDSEASSIVDELIRDDPDSGWATILAVLERIDAQPSSRLFQVLAAGPLEDLLARHGDAFVERIESEARVNERFKLLLGGVWQNAMSEHVWRRVQACRAETW
ncbi:MAG TPA: hypothetical protein VFC18_21000 [Burkholderiales bacterium]|nr:hypothetical protein [Burkholderiales bacterium]